MDNAEDMAGYGFKETKHIIIHFILNNIIDRHYCEQARNLFEMK